jgi:hypothetical protein
MNTKYNFDGVNSVIANVPLINGEITVITSDSALDSLAHSLKLAHSAQNDGSSALYINCLVGRKRLAAYINANYAESGISAPKVHSSTRGDLVGDRETIDQMLADVRPGIVIITGWEWTSSNHRRKERLLHYLREIADRWEVPIVIYANNYQAPMAGRIDKGGLGKLSLAAAMVVEVKVLERLAVNVLPHQPARLIGKDDEIGGSALLTVQKIKDLQAGKPSAAISEHYENITSFASV